MRDEQDGGAELVLQFAEEVEDLRLDGDIERGGRLVGHQHGGAAGECDGDHHALAHAAGELVRVALRRFGGAGDADAGEECFRAGARLGRTQAEMAHQRLVDLPPDRHQRVQRGHRLLEDHRQPGAAQIGHLGFGEAEQIAPLEDDAVGAEFGRRRFQQAHEGERGQRLAAAAFADQAEGFAVAQLEGDAVDRLCAAAGDAEGDPELLRAQDRFGHQLTTYPVSSAAWVSDSMNDLAKVVKTMRS